MRKALLLGLALLGLPAAGWARPPVLIELYTAQGCGSCGEANAFVARLADEPGVLALTFPVDYWDYLGWADTLAKPEFTDRQKAYEARLSQREPYTPQVVVNGRAESPGQKTDRIETLVREARKASVDPPDIRFVGARRLDVGSGRAPKGGAEVWLLRYDPRAQDVAVKSGDNRGQTIVQRNVVRDLARVGAWTGKPRAYRLPPASEEGLRTLVVVQGAHGGPVIALREGKDPAAAPAAAPREKARSARD